MRLPLNTRRFSRSAPRGSSPARRRRPVSTLPSGVPSSIRSGRRLQVLAVSSSNRRSNRRSYYHRSSSSSLRGQRGRSRPARRENDHKIR